MIKTRNKDTYSSDIYLEEKLYKENHENILIYYISYKSSMDEKPLRFMFNKIDGFIKVHNRIKYLV